MGRALFDDAMDKQITRESVNMFSLQVKKTVESVNSDKIDKIIGSMDNG